MRRPLSPTARCVCVRYIPSPPDPQALKAQRACPLSHGMRIRGKIRLARETSAVSIPDPRSRSDGRPASGPAPCAMRIRTRDIPNSYNLYVRSFKAYIYSANALSNNYCELRLVCYLLIGTLLYFLLKTPVRFIKRVAHWKQFIKN